MTPCAAMATIPLELSARLAALAVPFALEGLEGVYLEQADELVLGIAARLEDIQHILGLPEHWVLLLSIAVDGVERASPRRPFERPNRSSSRRPRARVVAPF